MGPEDSILILNPCNDNPYDQRGLVFATLQLANKDKKQLKRNNKVKEEQKQPEKKKRKTFSLRGSSSVKPEINSSIKREDSE